MNKQELTYWVTLSMIPKMWTKRKNEIYVNCYKSDPQISIIDLFEDSSKWESLGLTADEMILFKEAYTQLANNSFLVEELLAQGYHIIPLDSKEYPPTLKKNLGIGAPTILYAKGDIGLLHDDSVAIVGSRKANDTALQFTSTIAQRLSVANKVIVSGFAKGVDKMALDASIDAGGKSIIVLPQGITTFTRGYKQYYRQIVEGKVLVVSQFFPKAPWSVEFAMARNTIIYGLSNSIYVAQTDETGGTWTGAINGLRKGRNVYVRAAEPSEKVANDKLIEKGAIPVDMQGNILVELKVESPAVSYDDLDSINKKIIKLLKVCPLTSKEIISGTNSDWTDAKMKKYLRSLPEVVESKIKNKIRFHLKDYESPSLFNDL